MNSIDKLFLLDAYALIYRAYYAFIKNPRINSKGFNTSAILGFVNTLEEVLKKRESHTHRSSLRPVGPHLPPRGLRAIQGTARGDTRGHPPFRTYYKGHHPRLPHSHPRSIRLQADDVIGTLATEAGRQGITTYMMTPDKDYGQLVSDRVFMYRPKHTGGFEVMGTEE